MNRELLNVNRRSILAVTALLTLNHAVLQRLRQDSEVFEG